MKLRKFTTTDQPAISLNRTFRFTFSDSGVDRDGDRLYASGWDTDEYEDNPIVLFSHDAEQPIGRAKNVHVEDGRLVGDIEFADTDLASTVYDLVQGGFLRAVSVGFLPLDYEFSKDRKGGIDYKKQRLLEVSIVSIPSNPRALIEQPPFGKILRQAREAGISIAPVMKWMADKLLDSTTFPTERLVYRDTINSMNESDPSSGGFAVDDDKRCNRGADEECEYDDPEQCCVHRREQDDDDGEKTLMASTKAMKAAHDELLRLRNLIKQLELTVVTKADDDSDDDGSDDPEYRSMGLKIAHGYVRAARLFHKKAIEAHEDACKQYNAFHKDDEPDADDEKDDDDVEQKDDAPDRDDDDDDGDKRFVQIMARARAATR